MTPYTFSRRALLTTALLLSVTALPAAAQEALAGTLPAPPVVNAAPSAQPVFVPAAPAPSNPAPGLPVAAAPTVSPALPSPSAAAPVGLPAPVSAGAPSVLGFPSPAGGDLTKSPATPQIVQDAVSRLQKTDAINLDDMIRAQDAINRLDLLLEIEKRQTELKKIRDERNKPAAGSLFGGIPSSALNLPPIKANIPPPPPKSSSSEDKPVSSPKEYTVQRITGSDGRYVAVIDTGDGKMKTVKVGDKMPDGSKVKDVSLTEVGLVKDGKSKTLTISSDSYIVRESSN